LRTVFALAVFNAGGLLLHAAGIVHNQFAYLFSGHSGSGKSTVTQLISLENALNDDLVLLLPKETGWVAYATPFWNAGMEKRNRPSARVAGVFSLVQDTRDFLLRMDKSHTVAELVSNVPVIPANINWGKELLLRCESLAKELNAYELHFQKKHSFWELITGLID